ncbi:MAG TPA: tRNA adenosine(34) deaminase TadA [Polyangiaceae bacterium]|nr:tRNA adenosine(34) deaminase TadA [Polyangiaceae bacterium]
MTDDDWMQIALNEAALAPSHADIPVGAVLVSADGRELARGHNQRESAADPTAHAEIVVLRAATAAQGHWRLTDTTLYVTLEPCPMCAGALINARVARLVYGCTDPKAGAIDTLYQLGNDSRLNHRLQVQGGMQAEASRAQLQQFFQALRREGQK